MKNIVFDAKCLSYKFVKNNERSGIFFVAYNVFLELSKNYNISLYFKDEDFFLKHYYQFFNDDIYNKSQIYNDVGKYLQKIPNLILKFGKLTQEKKKERNKIKKIWLVIKLFFLKKIIKIYKAKDFDNNLKNMDFYISPAYMIPEKISKNDKIKKAIILYDTVPDIFTEEYFKNINREEHWYTQMTRKLNKYLYCFCISESTKDNFLKYYKDKLDENKMIVMPIATSQSFFQDKDQSKLDDILNKYNVSSNQRNKYIFSLCSLEPRKNLIFTIKCFIEFIKKNKINDLYFYLGGDHYSDFIKILEKEIQNLDEYKDKIVKLGYIDDEDLNTLYSNSLFFTYISIYEGFGMPPLEAMSCGVPVITSNTSSLPEVVGDAAIMIDPTDKEACIKAMENLYFNEDLRKELSQKGLEQAKKFTWEKTVDIMVNEYLK